jgi:FAD/FMN-containing dehydrogenase
MKLLVGCPIHHSQAQLLNKPLALHRGSISAEHGIGAMKTHALPYSKSATSIGLMRKIKVVFDPRGIMNPGKVLEQI